MSKVQNLYNYTKTHEFLTRRPLGGYCTTGTDVVHCAMWLDVLRS
jgi:hypothetical protein